jgi:hypothetical protein
VNFENNEKDNEEYMLATRSEQRYGYDTWQRKTYRCICHEKLCRRYWGHPPGSTSENENEKTANKPDHGNEWLVLTKESVRPVSLGIQPIESSVVLRWQVSMLADPQPALNCG